MRRSAKTKSRFEERARQERGRRALRVRRRCFFCEKGTNPDFRDEVTIGRFLTRRGKIRPRERSGLCARHQRLIRREIKRARQLGLLPYRILG